jgi:hypothetical protein
MRYSEIQWCDLMTISIVEPEAKRKKLLAGLFTQSFASQSGVITYELDGSEFWLLNSVRVQYFAIVPGGFVEAMRGLTIEVCPV